MTRAAWLASRAGGQMLLQVPRAQHTPRKSLLFACGCVRWNLEHRPDSADVNTPEYVFSPARDPRGWLAGAEAAADGNPSIREQYASSIAGQKSHHWLSSEGLAQVTRELYVYPFGPVPLREEWLTADVLAMAATIDTHGWFEDMPVLGDALEDAGCADEGVLRHCRDESRHLRGCWVLDSLLRRRTTGWRDQYRPADRTRAAEVPEETLRASLVPDERFPGGYFLVGTEGEGYVISTWHPEHGVCTLVSDDNPWYFAATERLLADGASRFPSSAEARSAHDRHGSGGR